MQAKTAFRIIIIATGRVLFEMNAPNARLAEIVGKYLMNIYENQHGFDTTGMEYIF
jgi:hypothetical protein